MNEQGIIPLLDIKLPITGVTVKLNQWLTTGQSRELQKILLEGGQFNPQTQQLENLNSATFLQMQDRAAEFLLRGYIDGNGTEQPANLEWLGNLPQDDGSLVYDKISELINRSGLNEEAKKK